MADEIEVTDIFDRIGSDDSEVASSEDEYVPRASDLSESEEEVGPSTSRGPRINPRAKKRRHVTLSDDSDDDIPLSTLKQKLHDRREQEDLEIISQMLEEPMWEDMPMAQEDTSFKGMTEEAPQYGLKTPYEYLRDLVTDDMLDNVVNQSNHYALIENGIELKTTRKEIEIFICLYLRMGLMKGHCVRAYWASETRYPLVADEMSRNRFEQLARNLHFVDNTAVSAADGLIQFQRPCGRPSDSNATPPTNKWPSTVEHRPNADVRLDQTGHFLLWTTRGRCKAASSGFTFVYCVKCKLHLGFNKDHNCFTNYHIK